MKFRYDINALRALAVSIVVLYHFGVPGFSFGFIGVDIFFVVSGFLMTKIIVEAIEKETFSLNGFIFRRAKRIVPALLSMILLLTVIAWLLLLPNEFKTFSAHGLTSGLFISNEYYAQNFGYFDTAPYTKWLLHTWSLSVEWQFYIVLPLLLIFVNRFFPKRILLFIILVTLGSIVTCLIYNISSSTRLYYGLESRAWELLFGSIAYLLSNRKALYLQGRKKYFLALLFLGLSLPFSTIVPGWPNLLTTLPVIATAYILINATQLKIYTTKPIYHLGLWSYSIYLWHWPAFVVLKNLGFTNWYSAALGILLSTVLGAMSYYLIEVKLTNFLFQSKNKFWLYVKISAAGSIFITVLFAVFITNGAAFRYTETSRAALAVWLNSLDKDERCATFEEFEGACIIKGQTTDVDFIIVGDSHAGSIKTAFHDSKNLKGATLVFSMEGCPLLTKGRMRGVQNPEACSIWTNKVIEYISVKYKDIPIVISNRVSAYLQNQTDLSRITIDGPLVEFESIMNNDAEDKIFLSTYMDEFFGNIDKLSLNNPLILVAPIPEFPFNVPKKAALVLNNEDFDKTDEITISKNEYLIRNHYFLEELRKRTPMKNIRILDPTKVLCDDRLCYGTQDFYPIYSDSDHLTYEGSKRLGILLSDLL